MIKYINYEKSEEFEDVINNLNDTHR